MAEAKKIITSTSDPTTSNKSTTQYVSNDTKWRNTTSGDVFICVDAGAGTWEKIHDESESTLGDIKIADKIITTGQVLALNATPIAVLAAVGSGVYPVFLGAYVLLDYNSAAYADDAGEDLVFTQLSAGAEVSHTVDGSEFDGTADACIWVGPKAAEASATTTLVDNGGFEVTIKAGEWVTGDSPLKIRLFYRTITKADLVAIA